MRSRLCETVRRWSCGGETVTHEMPKIVTKKDCTMRVSESEREKEKRSEMVRGKMKMRQT